MTKADKLKKLDDLVLDRMITFIDQNKIELLSELSTAVQYLKANQVVEPPKPHGADPVEARKKKLEEAKKRRGE